MSGKWAMRALGLVLALGALAALYAVAPERDTRTAKAKDNPAAEEKTCAEGCWLPFF